MSLNTLCRSKSFEMTPFSTSFVHHACKSLLVFHCDYVSRTVSETIKVKKWRDLEIRVKDHSRSLEIVPFDVSLTCAVPIRLPL